MGKVRVAAFTISVDGFGAGPDQSLDDPLGRGGEELHRWLLGTRTFRELQGEVGDASQGIDDQFVRRSFDGIGAWIMGRNMFGPIRGPWPDDDWKGWWGDEPPYHVPTFVLTHHRRAPVAMAGGTTFHFVSDGIASALAQARAAAGERDVRIGGGVALIRQFLEADLIDEMHLVVSPILLGHGESLLEGIDLPARGFRVAERAPGESALHVVLQR